jgi:outer membrane protein TolC
MKKVFAFLLLNMIYFYAASQRPDSTYSFSIKEAINFTLQNHKDVVNAQLDADIARYKVRETVGIGLPQLSASFDVKDFEKIPTQFIPDFISPTVYGILYDENLIAQQNTASGQLFPVQFGTRWNATADISASQILFDPSYIIGVSASKTFRELSQKNSQRTKIEAAAAVTKAYYSVLLLRERKKIVDANSARLQKLLNDTKALYDNGFVEKLDHDRIKVAYNNIQTETENFNRVMEMSENMLKFQIGIPQTATIKITDTLNAESVKQIQVTMEQSDPSRRIEYSILKTQERLQTYNLKRYKAQYLPSLFAYGGLSTSAQRNEFNIFESGYRWYPTGVIGAKLSLNLFDGLQRESRIKQQRLELRKINNEVANIENAINLEVNTSRSSLLTAVSSLKLQDDNLELATSVANTAKIKYDQGVGSNLEILDAETSLKEAQVNYFNALYNAVIAKIDLDKALGTFSY